MMWMFLLACVQPKSAQDFYLAEHGVWTFDPNDLCDSTSCRFDEVDEILDVAAAQFESVDFLCEQHNTRLLFAKYRRQVRA